jgi:hypothetical protein
MEFTFKEMLAAINSKVSGKKWKASKLRYYLLDVLNEKVGTPGQEATYPAKTLGKLLFLVEVMENPGPLQPTIKQAVLMLEKLSDEDLTRIGSGEEEIEYGVPDVDESGTAVYRTLSGRTAPQHDHPFGRVMDLATGEEVSPSADMSMPITDPAERKGAADYVASQFASYISRSEKTSVRRGPGWKTLSFGPDLQIRYRKPLTPGQKKQLRLAGELLQAVLGEED